MNRILPNICHRSRRAMVIAGLVLSLADFAQAQTSKFTADAAGNLFSQTSESIAFPQIIAQPRDQIIIPGNNASFSVLVADTRGVTYQWLFNNSPISGATSDALVITNVDNGDTGSYAVIVSNSSGSVTSSPATLYIDTDGDGLPDTWEMAQFGNLNQTASGDPDGDGVANLQEFLDGTDPRNSASVMYRINLVNDGGIVTLSPNQSAYASGQVVTLTAVGSSANPFHAWTGDMVTRSNSISIVMNTNRSLYAHFTPIAMTWTNSVPGDWNNAFNWSPNLAPGSNESAVIPVPVQVTLNSDVSLINFTFGGTYVGPDLTGSGRLTISGTGTWYSGSMSGSGATVVGPGATFTIANVAPGLALTGRTFENGGTTVWLNSGYMNMLNAVITNAPGASFQLGGAVNFGYQGGTPRFDNAGTFLVPSGAAVSFFNVAFNNSGTIHLTNGNYLSLGGGGGNSGTISVPAGTTLNLSGGTFTGTAGSSITGAGTFIVSGGANATLAGTLNVSGTNAFNSGTTEITGNYTCVGSTLLDISGGATVSFDGTGSVSPNNVNLNGYLGGAQNLTVSNSMYWYGGGMSGSGLTLIRPGATLTLPAFSGYGGVSLSGRTLENAGTTTCGGGYFNLLSATILNDAGAQFQITGPLAFNYQGGVSHFDNSGTFSPSPVGLTTFYNIAFNNFSTVPLSGSATLSLGGGGTNSGSMTVPAGTTLNLAGGTFTGTDGSTITGAGTFVVGGANATIAGTLHVTGTNSFSGGSTEIIGNYSCVGNTLLDISGGAVVAFDGTGSVSPNKVNLNGYLGGAQNLTVGSSMYWYGGTMFGSGLSLIQPGATLTTPAFSGYGGVGLTSRTLENAGTIICGGGYFNLLSATILNDAGAQFQMNGPSAFNYQGGVSHLDNSGTFSPSPSGLTAFYNVAFNNYSTVPLTGTGTLSLGGGGTNNGSISVPAGTTLALASGTFTGTAASSITGAGTFNVSGATANLAGTVNVSGANLFSGGYSEITGNYTCAGNTLLDISGSATVNFDGTGTVTPNNANLNGFLGGAQNLIVRSNLNWYGGAMTGPGRTIIPAGSTLAINNYSYVYLVGRTLDNAGTMLWSMPNALLMNDGIITNEAGGLVVIQSSTSATVSGGSPRFDNAGTIRKSANGTAFFGVPLNNYGTIEIQSGTIAASGGYTSSTNSLLVSALRGTVPGATFGQLLSPGAVNINGSLKVYLTNYFIPKSNDSFAVVTANPANGSFTNLIYPTNGLIMTLTNSPTAEIVRVTGASLQQTNSFTMPPGVISWWRSENNALDSVGTNHGAFSNGVSFATGEVGRSFLFDGLNGCVSIPDSPSLRPTSVTVEAWVKISSTDGTQLVFAKPLGTGSLDSYGLALQNGVPLAAVCDINGFGTFLSDTSALTLGQWHHLAYTYDGSTGFQALYTDGAMVASGTAGRSMNFDSHPLLLGGDIESNIPGYYLKGQIDEATLYNRALSFDEIASIYNVGAVGKLTASPVPQPILHIQTLTPQTARIFWSTNSPGYNLQFNTRLTSTNWTPTGLVPVIMDTNYVITNLLNGDQRYYRLSQ